MFGLGRLPGELNIRDQAETVAGLSEVLRIWYREGEAPVYFVDVEPVPVPEEFGRFMADAIRQVARAYAMQFADAPEADALGLIWGQFDDERAHPDARPATVVEPKR